VAGSCKYGDERSGSGATEFLMENLPPLSLQAFMVCSSVNRTTVDKKYLNQCLTVTNVKKLTLTLLATFP
jgi:hypothetical protein